MTILSYPTWKRMFDVALALVGLVVTAPLQVLVAVLIWCRMGRPVFFRQPRCGLLGKEFSVLKFRTMRDAVDEQGKPLPDHQRITGLGRFLRKHSLDEIPQLWNVMRGDMSVVGPRPLLARYLLRYSPFQARRHEVRPGITGLAQVRGRNLLDWESRFELDVWYVDHLTAGLDLSILLATCAKIWRTSDTTPEDSDDMPEFMGNIKE